jgi:hypothetical protein
MSMPDSIPSAVALLPCSEIRARIDQLLGEHFTGLAQAAFVPQMDMTLLICDGVAKQVYFEDAFSLQCHPGENWKDPLAKYSIGGFFIKSLPVQALLFQKIVIEQRLRSTPVERKTTELLEIISSYEKREKAVVLQVIWKNAQAFVFVPGSGISSPRVIFHTAGIVEEGRPGLARISTWGERNCSVNAYDCDLENAAFIELQLSMMFEWLCNYMLTQYGYLTGNVLVRSIVRNLIIFAAANELNIRERDCVLTDLMIFQSADEAADAYRKLLNSVRHQMRTVIGSNLLASIEKQALNSLSGMYQEMARNYQLL